jgi:hypothetical protein
LPTSLFTIIIKLYFIPAIASDCFRPGPDLADAPRRDATPFAAKPRVTAMRSITMFDSTKENLLDLLRSLRECKTQLPDFQRGWVWDDLHIRSLLASVSMSYPVGAVMMLQTGNPDVRFKPRPVEGIAPPIPPVEPERLILDGQQRLTSLFQSLLLDKAVLTKDIRDKPPVVTTRRGEKLFHRESPQTDCEMANGHLVSRHAHFT